MITWQFIIHFCQVQELQEVHLQIVFPEKAAQILRGVRHRVLIEVNCCNRSKKKYKKRISLCSKRRNPFSVLNCEIRESGLF